MPERKKSPGKKSAPTAKSKARKNGPARERKTAKAQDNPVHIVGIGSSAGGLEALKVFFHHMPADSGMAFILVPHLDPTGQSIMHELLRKHTSMPVDQVENDTRVEANRVYIIPPGKLMSIINGSLQLVKSVEKPGLRHPIDYFFRSLAEDQKEKGIGIILSGTGSEGVLGTKAIKGEAGVVMAQEPGSAKFDTMPSAAIATGMVDWILPPEEMPGQLVRYAGSIPGKKQPLEEMLKDDVLQKIFFLIRTRTGHDFSRYKPKTIMRRIVRRMAINQINDVGRYIRYVQENPDEIDLLFRELLIRVTNFFRDPAAFAVLQEKVMPYIMQHSAPNDCFRVWVPACASGEEAYSVAIVLDEYLHQTGQSRKFQIFATDIDGEAVETARRGIYPESISVDVSAERLQRYFDSKDSSYQVKKQIREMIVFAVQNIIKDPPLSRMDLICCRNLLIYFSSDLQQKIMSIFHYALKPGAILFLGASETIGASTDLFSSFDSKWKIFKKVGKSVYRHNLHFSPRHPAIVREEDVSCMEAPHPSIDELTEKLLLELYAPACVLIRDDGTIIYFYGRTGNYLEPAHGRAKLNIYDMARQGLRNPLLDSVKKVRMGQQEASYKGLRVKTNGARVSCNLKVMRISKPEALEGLLLVVFEDAREQDLKVPEKASSTLGRSGGRVKELENELENVKTHLQNTIAELETSNEELQSSNEELQSANEELETSREELQSVNEELMTVNSEAQEKIEQLTHATNDMKNLLSSTEIATIFLDMDLRIRNFTPDAVRIFKLIQSDIGRPLGDITNMLQYEGLEDDLREVVESLIPQEKQILDANGFWYLMKILPYRTQNHIIEGVILTFIDISKQKHFESLLANSEKRMNTFLDQSGEGYVLIDCASGSITDFNPAFQKLTGRHAWQLKDMKIWDLVPYTEKEATRKSFLEQGSGEIEGTHEKMFLGPAGKPENFLVTGKIISISGRKYLQCFMRKA
ncbi:MAG: CheR family methyltransferase [Desulfobulbaceae bacterium]|nr:CheR family methyltransferase [Desulfobulbaceae bacterium]